MALQDESRSRSGCWVENVGLSAFLFEKQEAKSSAHVVVGSIPGQSSRLFWSENLPHTIEFGKSRL